MSKYSGLTKGVTCKFPYIGMSPKVGKKPAFCTKCRPSGKNQMLPVFTAKFAFAANFARNWFKRCSGPYSVV